MIQHVRGTHLVIDQHQPAKDVPDRRPLVSVNNATVLQSLGMKPQEVIILGEQDPPFD